MGMSSFYHSLNCKIIPMGRMQLLRLSIIRQLSQGKQVPDTDAFITKDIQIFAGIKKNMLWDCVKTHLRVVEFPKLLGGLKHIEMATDCGAVFVTTHSAVCLVP